MSTMTSTTTSSTVPITTTTSTTVLRPSPTVWRELGCYADRPNRSILAKLVSDKDGDTALTIPKCQDTCYRLNYEYAGVKAGNQCWCSGYVAGEWTPHKTDCNMACTGDATKNCGGKDCLNVFGAVKPDPVTGHTTSTGISTGISTATSTHSATISTLTAGAAQPSKASSGAMKNLGFL
ncbi:WSC domain-containing protein [Trichoderma sp. SZMC 28015]